MYNEKLYGWSVRFFSFLLIFSLHISAVFAGTITENFSSSTYKDFGSTTGDWNEGLGRAQAALVVNVAGTPAVDLGTGADGNCSFSGTIASGTYNCITLTTTGTVQFSGTSNVVFKVLGAVTINGNIDARGNAGTNGTNSDTVIAGGTAGPGGSDGGSSPGATTDNGNAGSGTGAGSGGVNGNGAVFGTSGGGGGGGGVYSTVATATNGATGNNDGAGNNGAGGARGAATYGNQNAFDTTLLGGSGGGAGGSGDDSGGGLFTGAGGGGGGGVVHIAAGGAITIAAGVEINTTGGKGGNGFNPGGGGGGGGGSGGTIFLQSGQDITLTGVLRAEGGTGGTSGTGGPAGNGGFGGDGRIRLDDQDGAVVGTSTPIAQYPSGTNAVSDVDFKSGSNIIQSRGYDTRGRTNRFTSVTVSQTLNGGTISLTYSDSADNSTWGAWTSDITTLSKRYIRFRADITPDGGAAGETTPIINSIAFNYTVTQGLDEEINSFTSDITCGSIDFDDKTPNWWPFFFMLFLMMGISEWIRSRKKRS